MLQNEKKVIAFWSDKKEKKGSWSQWHFPVSSTEPDKNDWFPHQVASFVSELLF